MKNIVVLGFGRSGTTWISDIISKIAGGLILFEPLHPSVTELSGKFSYASVQTEEDSALLRSYLEEVLKKEHRKLWLMRNHVPVGLDKISADFLNVLWEECTAIGFKEIRGNFMIRWLKENLDSKILFVVRHPCAVISSIKNRHNFWEFGWPRTYDKFLERTAYSDSLRTLDAPQWRDVVDRATTDIEKVAVMWGITHAVVLPELEELKIPVFYYEEIYRDPFPGIRAILDYLGMERRQIHPSHIFTPSMTTLRTVHGLYELEDEVLGKGAAFFWEKVLSEAEVETVLNIVRSFGIDIYDETGYPVSKTRKY